MPTPNTSSRKEKIKELQRKEERNSQLPAFLQAISNISGRQIAEPDILTLTQIDTHIISLNGTDFQFNYINLSFPKTKLKELSEKLQVLESQLNQDNYISLSKLSNTFVLITNAYFVINKFKELIALDGNTLSIYDANYLNGLWIDLHREFWFLDGKAELTDIYELRIFGAEWIKLIGLSL